MTRIFAPFVFALAVCWADQSVLAQQVTAPANTELMETAKKWVASLNDEQSKRSVFEFNDEERENWHFVPKVRAGLPLSGMTDEQRELAMRMLKSTLSEKGLKQTKEIMLLESVLAAKENRPEFRDPTKYYVAIFGQPQVDSPWGWRFEGHHVSLNFSSLAGATVSATPTFCGSSPATVMSGPHKGLRPLGPEEDAGRALVLSLSQPQRNNAIIADVAPKDVVTGTDRVAHLESKDGLPMGLMNDSQKAALQALIRIYLERYSEDQLERLKTKVAKEKNLIFAWAGSTKPGEPHYYRVVGDQLLIEYDNTQNEANHAHSVIRFFDNDFGRDLLKEHLEHAHPHD